MLILQVVCDISPVFANTNNVMPFTYGDIHKLKPFIDIEGVAIL